MSDLEKALDEYLDIRRALGFKLRDEGTALPQFLIFLKKKDALKTEPTSMLLMTWHFSGQPYRKMFCRHIGRVVSPWYAILRSFAVRWTPGPRSRPETCFLFDIVANRHTSMMKVRSYDSLKPQVIFSQQSVCVPQHIPRCSDCLLSLACGSASQLLLTAEMWT